MSSPSELQQHSPPQLPQAQAPWQQAPSIPRQHNGLAITALVMAGVALVISAGGFFASLFVGSVLSALPGGINGVNEVSGVDGTAPQVVTGQVYPGKLLQDELTRIAGNDIGKVTSMSCPATPAVVVDAVTVCHGMVEGSRWTFKVTFTDGLGHFNLDQQEN